MTEGCCWCLQASKKVAELASYATDHLGTAQQQLEELQEAKGACESQEQLLESQLAEVNVRTPCGSHNTSHSTLCRAPGSVQAGAG